MTPTLRRIGSLLLFLSLTACASTSPVPVSTDHPKYGRETWLATASIASKVESLPSNGAVIAHEFSSGDSVVTAKINIPAAPAGQEYVVRLESDAAEPLVVGTLVNPLGDVRHLLAYEAKTTLSSYTHARVYRVPARQKTGGTLVAEGELVARKAK